MLVRSIANDTTGPSAVPAWAATGIGLTGVSCGFEILDAKAQKMYPIPPDAVVRVPAGTAVTKYDRIQMTKRNGATISETYSIMSPILDRPTATIVGLKRIEGA